MTHPDDVAALIADIEAARTLTRGQLARAAELLKIDHPINLSDPDNPRRELTARQAATKPVLRADMSAFSDLAVPEGEVVIAVSGVPPHEVTLLHIDRFAYVDGKETEPDWYDESGEHPSCDHAAWLLAILTLRFGPPDN